MAIGKEDKPMTTYCDLCEITKIDNAGSYLYHGLILCYECHQSALEGKNDRHVIDLQAWADSHETDIEIVESIANLANYDRFEMQRMWQDPTEAEIIAIWEDVTNNGQHDDTLMAWGIETLSTIAEGIV
jgi:hypothetical protein